MENKSFDMKISLYDLFAIFLNKLWIILLTTLIVGAGAYAYSYYTYQPTYTSISKIYILRQNDSYDETAQGYAQNLNAALNTVNDCKLIVKTETTMQSVIEATGIDRSATDLMENVYLTSAENSRIVLITAKASTPEEAKLISDTVAVKGVERIKTVMGFDQANIMEEGGLPTEPSNALFPPKMILLTIMSTFIAYAFFIIKFLTNDKISEPEELTNYLGLTVLGVLPKEDLVSDKKKHRGYKTYYKYTRYSSASSSGDDANKKHETNSKKKRGEIS